MPKQLKLSNLLIIILSKIGTLANVVLELPDLHEQPTRTIKDSKRKCSSVSKKEVFLTILSISLCVS